MAPHLGHGVGGPLGQIAGWSEGVAQVCEAFVSGGDAVPSFLVDVVVKSVPEPCERESRP